MPTTAASTVSVDREAVIDALAHLEAAGELFVALNESRDSDLFETFMSARAALQDAAFGRLPDDADETWHRDPVEVEVSARGKEIAASALGAALDEGNDGPLGLLDHETVLTLPRRARQLREYAATIRERGTIAVGFGGDDG